MEKYWEKEITNLCDGIIFKFKKMNAVEHLNLVTKNVDFERLDGDRAEYFINKCLSMTIWSRDGQNWNNLIDAEGRSKLPEFEDNVSIGLDLFYYFKRDVLAPVFLESKTFQNSMKEIEQEIAED